MSTEKKHVLLLSMTFDIKSLSEKQCYVHIQFLEVSTATESDLALVHSKGAQKF